MSREDEIMQPILATNREKILDRMLQVLGEKQDRAIAKFLEKTPQAISRARSKQVPRAWVEEFAEREKVSIEWLLTGADQTPLTEKAASPDDHLDSDDQITIKRLEKKIDALTDIVMILVKEKAAEVKSRLNGNSK